MLAKFEYHAYSAWNKLSLLHTMRDTQLYLWAYLTASFIGYFYINGFSNHLFETGTELESEQEILCAMYRQTDLIEGYLCITITLQGRSNLKSTYNRQLNTAASKEIASP